MVSESLHSNSDPNPNPLASDTGGSDQPRLARLADSGVGGVCGISPEDNGDGVEAAVAVVLFILRERCRDTPKIGTVHEFRDYNGPKVDSQDGSTTSACLRGLAQLTTFGISDTLTDFLSGIFATFPSTGDPRTCGEVRSISSLSIEMSFSSISGTSRKVCGLLYVVFALRKGEDSLSLGPGVDGNDDREDE